MVGYYLNSEQTEYMEILELLSPVILFIYLGV